MDRAASVGNPDIKALLEELDGHYGFRQVIQLEECVPVEVGARREEDWSFVGGGGRGVACISRDAHHS